MGEPKRVQMTRNKPWRADNPDAVIVDRRTKWGNEFVVQRVEQSRLAVWAIFYRLPTMLVRLDEGEIFATGPEATAEAVQLYRMQMVRWAEDEFGEDGVAEVMAELRGRDLACWCKPGDPCHADVLLELANPPALVDRDGTNTEQEQQ